MRKSITILPLFLMMLINASAQWTTSGTNIYNSNTGNVGIGTSSPSNLLTLEGNASPYLFVKTTGSTLAGIGVGDGPNSVGLQYYPTGNCCWPAGTSTLTTGSAAGNFIFYMNHDMQYLFGGAEKLRITSGGNLGIGISVPTSPLHVSTTATLIAQFKATSASNSMISVANNTGQVNLGIGSITPQPYIWSSTDNFFIGGDGSPTMYIKGMSGGSVGIGTTNLNDVNYKLFVETGIRTRKVRVDQISPWPDYVFESTYQLPSLQDVEKYIQANKHLPDFSSAKQIKEDGLDLGDNQTLLLKKLEELTLYVIEQNKKSLLQDKLIQELGEKLTKQQEDINALKKTANKN